MNEPEIVLLDPLNAMQEVCKIWPGNCVCEPGTIEENRTYLFELRYPPSPLQAHFFLDDQRLKRDILDSPLRIQWEWKVEFHAGEVEILIQLEQLGGVIRRNLVTDPDRRKLSRKQFDTMIRQILDDTFALLSLSSYKFGIAIGNTSCLPAIARLEYLRSQIDALERVIRAIDKNPVRVLRATMEEVPFHKVTRLTAGELMKSLSSGKMIQGHNIQGGLPKALAGRIPTRVYKAQKTLGVDIREHRDMKSALTSWSAWLLSIADLLESKTEDKDVSIQHKTWALRCRKMSMRLGDLLRLPLFREVQNIKQPVYATQTYQRMPAYGQFLSLYNNFQKGVANIVGDYLNVPLARTYDLYELWAFLRLVRAASIMFPDVGFNPDSLFAIREHAVTVMPYRVLLDFGEHLRLCFQRTYREFWIERDGRGTYSRYMRPDFTIETSVSGNDSNDKAQRILIVLDAKYRVETGLNDALSSIHTYRDALVCEEGDGSDEMRRIVTGAYLLTPDMYAVDGEWKALKMPARLFHPEYRGHFRFGAITMQPGIKDEEVISLLNTVIEDCTESRTGHLLS